MLTGGGGAAKAKFPEPPEFTGERTKFSAWKSQVTAYLYANQQAYSTDALKCAYTVQKL